MKNGTKKWVVEVVSSQVVLSGTLYYTANTASAANRDIETKTVDVENEIIRKIQPIKPIYPVQPIQLIQPLQPIQAIQQLQPIKQIQLIQPQRANTANVYDFDGSKYMDL